MSIGNTFNQSKSVIRLSLKSPFEPLLIFYDNIENVRQSFLRTNASYLPFLLYITDT